MTGQREATAVERHWCEIETLLVQKKRTKERCPDGAQQKLIAGHEADAIVIKNEEVESFFMNGKDDFGAFLINYRPDRGESYFTDDTYF